MGQYARWAHEYAVEQGGVSKHYAIISHPVGTGRKSQKCGLLESRLGDTRHAGLSSWQPGWSVR